MTESLKAPRRSPETLWARAAFAALVLLAALFVFALLQPEAPGGHGMPHPDYATMLRGGPQTPMPLLGWAVGAAQILLFGALMALGARRGPSLDGDTRGGGLRGMGPWLVAGLVAYLGVWTALMVAYARFLEDPSPALYGALPAPTAIMIYVLWSMPLFFAGLYVVGFRRWVFSERDEAAFAELVKRRHAAETNEASGGEG